MNRLNYVFVSKDIQVLSAQVGNERLSDHFPLIIDVALPPRAKKPD
jgi:endonuclease/exonuclease/phosphatase family metal-dependent hydrolase